MTAEHARGESDASDYFVTKDEERRFGEGLKEESSFPITLIPSVLVALIRKAFVILPSTNEFVNRDFFQEVTNHIARCSPCVRDSLAYAEEYKEHRRKQLANRLWAVGAMLSACGPALGRLKFLTRMERLLVFRAGRNASA